MKPQHSFGGFSKVGHAREGILRSPADLFVNDGVKPCRLVDWQKSCGASTYAYVVSLYLSFSSTTFFPYQEPPAAHLACSSPLRLRMHGPRSPPRGTPKWGFRRRPRECALSFEETCAVAGLEATWPGVSQQYGTPSGRRFPAIRFNLVVFGRSGVHLTHKKLNY